MQKFSFFNLTKQFKILLSWGGPACQIIGKLDQYKQPTDIEIQYQDWGTPWEPLHLGNLCTLGTF